MPNYVSSVAIRYRVKSAYKPSSTAYPSFLFSKVAIFFNYIMTICSLSEGPNAIILTVVPDIT